jgi:flagellin
MGLRINTNIQSLEAQRNLSGIRRDQDNALSKLSSGQRIVKAGDDAAGLAISEKLKAQIRGNQQATRNAGDGISFIQTAEGGLNEVSNILIRLRELSVQSASDTVGETERQFSDYEYQHLVQEVDRISQSTKYNGRSLLNGEGEDADFQIGTMNHPTQDRLTFTPATTDATTSTLGIASTKVLTKVDAQENLETIDKAINHVNGNRANLGALQNRLQSTISNLEIKTENLSAANSRIRDADVAEETAKLARTNILTNSGTMVLSQANASGNVALKLIG